MLSLAPEGWCVESMRKAKGISLEEISNETKLKMTTLRAIEAGNLPSCPEAFTPSVTSVSLREP
jgi:hypothetical protein